MSAQHGVELIDSKLKSLQGSPYVLLSNPGAIKLLTEIRDALTADPEWSQVTESNLRAELASARADLEAEQVAEVFMTTLYTSALRHVEDERDRARAVATQLEQEVHALTVGSGRRVL
jgi:hypothetical protein